MTKTLKSTEDYERYGRLVEAVADVLKHHFEGAPRAGSGGFSGYTNRLIGDAAREAAKHSDMSEKQVRRLVERTLFDRGLLFREGGQVKQGSTNLLPDERHRLADEALQGGA